MRFRRRPKIKIVGVREAGHAQRVLEVRVDAVDIHGGVVLSSRLPGGSWHPVPRMYVNDSAAFNIDLIVSAESVRFT